MNESPHWLILILIVMKIWLYLLLTEYVSFFRKINGTHTGNDIKHRNVQTNNESY